MVGAHAVNGIHLGSLSIASAQEPLCNTGLSNRLSNQGAWLHSSPTPTHHGIAITLEGVNVSPDSINLKRILAFNLAGVLLLASWAIWPLSTLWSALDAQLFWLFNGWLTPENMHWNQILALINTRYFDVVSLGVLGLLFTMAIRADRRTNRLFHWVAIGVVMLVVAGLVSVAINEAITYGHPSPTLYFEQATRLTDLVSIPTKDEAGNSFPGDHGLMVMIFAAFMMRFAKRRLALWSIASVVLLSAPRILVGAHWFSDVYVGALSIALLVLPWILCTSVVSGMTRLAEKALRLFFRGN
jgi:membrane-associated phospholipid phosphatase